MGVCLINDNFEDIEDIIGMNYFGKDRTLEENENKPKKKVYKGQQIIKVNKFQLDRIKKQKILKKKTHDISNLGIEKNEEILLLSSPKKGRTNTESGNIYKSKEISPTIKSKKYDIINYPKDVFELINKIRSNPESFIKDIENAITNIQKYKNKLIYNGNIKIYLNKGEKMFNEAIECLRKTKSMKPLIFNKEI